MDASEPEFDMLKGHQTFLGSGESVRNAYPLYVTKAIYEGQRSTTDRKRVVIFTRSAYTGQQRNAAISWSGDISGGLDYTSTPDPRRPELQHGRNAVLDDGRRRFLPAERSIHDDAYHELLTRWFQYARILSHLPCTWMDFEC